MLEANNTCTENGTLTSKIIYYKLNIFITAIFGGITCYDDIRMWIRVSIGHNLEEEKPRNWSSNQ